MSVLYIFLFLSLLYHRVLLASATSKRVSTQQGDVLGKEEAVQLHNGQTKTVYKFLGIPYAQSPVRFKPPQPLSSQRPNDYDATYYRSVCLQLNYYLLSIKQAWPGFDFRNNMSEDCLFLNIYTPSTNCTTKYPVMVHFHGGSYVAGTPIRDVSPGEYLPTQGVVLVTVQYRLDAFGFFSTGDSEAPGNLGFLDQIEALKWIRDNIDGFCGNKGSITLLGESAGGSSVSLHYLSPLSKTLFHRGIAISGVALSFFALKSKNTVLKASKTIIRAFACEKQNSALTVKCLQSKSGSAIVKHNTDRFNVQPFVDNHFLLDEPRNLLKRGEFQKFPLLSGFVSNEGVNAFSNPNMSNIPEYNKELGIFFKQFIHFSKHQAPIAFDALSFQYTPWGDLQRSRAYRKNVVDMRSDYMILAPTHEVLSFHRKGGATTYMFEFAHRSRTLTTRKPWKGVMHEDTTAYKFGLPLLKSPKTNLRFDDDDRAVSKKMVTLFTNFAKFGNPNSPSTPAEWIAFDTAKKMYLKFQKNQGKVVKLASKYHPLRMAFWEKYFPKLLPYAATYGECKKSEAARP